MIKINIKSREQNVNIEKFMFVLFFIFVSSFIHGQVVLTNPGIPEKETIIYTQNTDGNLVTVKYIIDYKSSDNRSWMEYRSYSDFKEVLVKFNLDNLTAFYSEVWETKDDSSVHRTNEIINNSNKLADNELLIADAEGFLTSLRGFPWNKNGDAKIVFLNRSVGFTPELKVKGKETIQINDQSYECWKVQIGIGGLMGAVFPKSYYWYSVESPHYLVRSEAAGMPGSPKTTLELQSYKVN